MLDSTLNKKDHQKIPVEKRRKLIQKKLKLLETNFLNLETAMLMTHSELLIEPIAVS